MQPFLALTPVAFLTLIVVAAGVWVWRRPLRSSQSRSIVRLVAALCGVLCLVVGATSLAVVVRSLPHLVSEDLAAVAVAVLFFLPTGVVLMAYSLKGRAPQRLAEWLRGYLGAPPDDP